MKAIYYASRVLLVESAGWFIPTVPESNAFCDSVLSAKYAYYINRVEDKDQTISKTTRVLILDLLTTVLYFLGG